MIPETELARLMELDGKRQPIIGCMWCMCLNRVLDGGAYCRRHALAATDPTKAIP